LARALASPCFGHEPKARFTTDIDLGAHVKGFKATIRANGEIDYVDIVILFYFTFKHTMSD
jgi:hypothetical protein